MVYLKCNYMFFSLKVQKTYIKTVLNHKNTDLQNPVHP